MSVGRVPLGWLLEVEVDAWSAAVGAGLEVVAVVAFSAAEMDADADAGTDALTEAEADAELDVGE